MAKFDVGKVELSLVYASFKESIAKVRMLGVKKYGHREDWRTVERVRYYDAALRHLDQATKAEVEGNGKMIDEESGESHLAHAACCLMFLIESDATDKIVGRVNPLITCDRCIVTQKPTPANCKSCKETHLKGKSMQNSVQDAVNEVSKNKYKCPKCGVVSGNMIDNNNMCYACGKKTKFIYKDE